MLLQAWEEYMQKQKHRDLIVKLEITNEEGVHVVYRGAEGVLVRQCHAVMQSAPCSMSAVSAMQSCNQCYAIHQCHCPCLQRRVPEG